MTKWLKIGSIITIIAAISVLILGSLTLAQSPDTGGKDGPRLERLAEKLGMTTAELQAALDSGKTIEELAAEKGVTLPARPEGKGPRLDKLAETLGMTTAELQAALDSGKTIEELAAEKGVTLPARPERPDGLGKSDEVLADLLGMTTDELATARQNGQSITALLEAKGLTQQDLAKAKYEAALEQLASAVTEGKLTQDQTDQMKEKLTERYENCVNNNQCGPDGGGMRPPRR